MWCSLALLQTRFRCQDKLLRIVENVRGNTVRSQAKASGEDHEKRPTPDQTHCSTKLTCRVS